MEKYEIIKDLGAGSFGVAKLCRDKDSSELVAIKFIERGPTIDENVEREIINHRSLRHPNIVRFKEVILTPTHLALVMEYASGGELFERICKWGRFTEDEARYYFRQLIFGVNYIHSMQICHRDLKLDNILLDGMKSPCLKICDFGYSKRISHRDLKLKLIILHERKSSEMKNCDSDCFKQIFKGNILLQSTLSDGSLAVKLKKITWNKDSMLDSILLDGCPAPQSLKPQCFIQQIRDRDMTINNVLSDGSLTPQMKRIYRTCLMLNKNLSDKTLAEKLKTFDFGFSKQTCTKYMSMLNIILSDGSTSTTSKLLKRTICKKDQLILDNVNTLSVSDGSRTSTPELKLKLQPKPNTNVGSPTYTAPEVLSGRSCDGKTADVWSCGVTLHAMLFAAYPFDDPDDSENSEKTFNRIMSEGYKIPDCVHISKDCQHLLSRIFVRNPSKRISVKEIMNHPWFSKNIQSEASEELFFQRDNPTLSHQSVEEIMKIVREARKQLAPLSTTIMGYESNTEEDHDPMLKEEEED
ncbi:serine/threonine-protein kinase SRK2G isoform X2 [Cucumis sativus]|uniref:serine/threonine-protein kinase SRK2G isoform X2 n=1 Tax=Cucumis sativus TaxID=3659 RepID=UPI0012F50AB5|nr:serine/threonine-protein kinase SRK2G isoform X2 [Cucumis sativus]